MADTNLKRMYGRTVQLLMPPEVPSGPHFWIYIYLYRMVLLRLNCFDKQDDFDFDIYNCKKDSFFLFYC